MNYINVSVKSCVEGEVNQENELVFNDKPTKNIVISDNYYMMTLQDIDNNELKKLITYRDFSYDDCIQ